MTAGEKIRDAAYSWLGTPYEGCAKVKGVGVDCGQLLIAAVEDAGLIQRGTVQTGTYSQEWHLHRSEEKYLSFIERYCEPVTGEPQPGDFALYKFGRGISHGDVVDLNRENIPGFDVREFYVQLVADLKARGL